MRISNLKTKTEPLVIHAPGFTFSKHNENFQKCYQKMCPLWPLVYESWSKSLRMPDCNEENKNVTVLTTNNSSKPGILEKSLQGKIPLKVIGKDVQSWRNILKIKLYCDALDSIQTPFVMGLDCFDVIVIGGINEIVDRFQKMDCQMLFNANQDFYPDCNDGKNNKSYITDDWNAFELRHSDGSFWPYLNAGAWIGKTDFVKAFFQDAINRTVDSLIEEGRLYNKKDTHQTIKDSEQIIMHWMFFDYYPKVKIDSRCIIFQNIVHIPIRGYIKIRPIPLNLRMMIYVFKNYCNDIVQQVFNITRPLRGLLGLRKQDWISD